MLPPKCFCKRRIICAVSAISGSKYKTCFPSLKYFSINFTYTCVLPLPVTPCNKQTGFSSKAIATSLAVCCCASLNSKSMITSFGKDFILSTLLLSTNKIFLSTRPFSCATVAPDFFSNAVCKNILAAT